MLPGLSPANNDIFCRGAELDKVTRVLMMFYELSRGRHISKVAFCQEHGITGRTFDRDIEDIRIFLSELYTNSELLFDRGTNTYFISNLYTI